MSSPQPARGRPVTALALTPAAPPPSPLEMTSSIGAAGAVSAAAARQAQPDRTIVALARVLRTQRQQGAATVALIARAAPEGQGRFVDAWA